MPFEKAAHRMGDCWVLYVPLYSKHDQCHTFSLYRDEGNLGSLYVRIQNLKQKSIIFVFNFQKRKRPKQI